MENHRPTLWQGAWGILAVIAATVAIGFGVARVTTNAPLWPIWIGGAVTVVGLYLVFAPAMGTPPFREKKLRLAIETGNGVPFDDSSWTPEHHDPDDEEEPCPGYGKKFRITNGRVLAKRCRVIVSEPFESNQELWWDEDTDDTYERDLQPGEREYVVLCSEVFDGPGTYQITVEALADNLPKPTVKKYEIDVRDGDFPVIRPT